MNERDKFNVVIWYPSDTYEYVCRFVSAQQAVEIAKRLTDSVGAKNGLITKIMITDGDDNTNFLWEHDKGLVYPTREELKKCANGPNTTS